MTGLRRASPCLAFLICAVVLRGLPNLVLVHHGRGPPFRLQPLRAEALHTSPAEPLPACVAVVGATGRTGQATVKALLGSTNCQVRAVARSRSKLESTFANETAKVGDRLQFIQCDVGDAQVLVKACDGADAAVWCVSGGAGGGLALGIYALQNVLKLPLAEEKGLAALGKLYSGGAKTGPPQVIMVSSAAVTRPTWSKEKRERLSGCADIPIVRLNPFGILDKKRAIEDLLRGSGARYTVVRPVGLNDDTPLGRPLLVQGDVAVGRISRADVASLIVELLTKPEATGKTFETLAISGYPKTDDYASILDKLRSDDDTRPPDEVAVAATYEVMQQLLPGEKQNSAALAMGQTYEQFDAGVEGRLGERGKERVPEKIG